MAPVGLMRSKSPYPFISFGDISISGDAALTNRGALSSLGGLTICMNGTLTNQTNGTLTNEGTLANDSGGTLINEGALTNSVSAAITNNGSIDTTGGTFTNNGVIGGTGHITGNVSGSGYIAPGQLAGGMTIDGHLTHDDGGHEIELGGLFNGGGDKSLTEFDWIDVTGNVELAGLLDVSLIYEFSLAGGMSFDILQVGGTLTGQYDGLGEGDLVGDFGGEDLFITYTAGSGNDVALYTIPEPAALLLALAAAPLRVRCG